jgi:signal transduction histidine kinase
LSLIDSTADGLAVVLYGLRASHRTPCESDPVMDIPVRPLVEQIFRWQQRTFNSPYSMLRLELSEVVIKWFPSRLRHILENLISNSIRFRDNDKGEMRLSLALRSVSSGYEFRLTDNGVGMAVDDFVELDTDSRSSPYRSSNRGVGLAVVKALVEQTGGRFEIESGRGRGTSCIVTLPYYDVGDFVD